MNFCKIFFIMFSTVIVSQCEADNYFENHFIFIGHSNFRNIINPHISSIRLRYTGDIYNPFSNVTTDEQHFTICKSLNTLSVFKYAEMMEHQSTFVKDILDASPTSFFSSPSSCSSNEEVMPEIPSNDRFKYFHSYYRLFVALPCTWKDSVIHISKLRNFKEYFLYIDYRPELLENHNVVYVHEPLGLIMEFFTMNKEDDDAKQKYIKILKKEMCARKNNRDMPLPPLVHSGELKLANSPYYQIFIIKLCASSFLYTIGAEKFRSKNIKELNLDVSIDELPPKELGINIKNDNDMSLTVVKCECNELINFIVPYLENKRKLFIVSAKKNNLFSPILQVSLDFPMSNEYVP